MEGSRSVANIPRKFSRLFADSRPLFYRRAWIETSGLWVQMFGKRSRPLFYRRAWIETVKRNRRAAERPGRPLFYRRAWIETCGAGRDL